MANVRNRIEDGFESVARVLYHHRIKTLLVMLILVAAIVSQVPRIEIDISTEGFLHNNDPALVDYNTFRDQFGRDELVIVAIRTPEVFDQEFLHKLKLLHDELTDKVPYTEEINSLINARNTRGEGDQLIVEDLLEQWPETDAEMAAIRDRVLDNPIYKNLLISEDGKITTVIIRTQTYSAIGDDVDDLGGFEDAFEEDTGTTGISEGSGNREYLTDEENSEVVEAVRRVVSEYDAPDFQVSVAGSSAVTHFLKQSMIKDVRKFLALAFLTIALFLFVMFRRVTGILLPLLIVIVSLLSTVGLMAMVGAPIKLPTQILPSFILAVSVGYSVHILAIFYYHYRKNRSKEDAVVYALGHSGLAIVLTAATTAGGLFSFSTSEVAPIADLGVFAGSGVLLAMVYTIILLPALLAIVPIRVRKGARGEAEDTLTDRLLSRVGRLATGRPYAVLIVSAVITAFALAGIFRIRFSHDPLRWLPETNDVRVATEMIDEELRGSANFEIIADTGKENGLYDPDLLHRLDGTAAYLESLNVGSVFAGKVWSLTTILKETNRALNENRREFYTVPQDRSLVAQELLLFENSGSDDMEDFTDSQFSKARMMVKMPLKDAILYTDFLQVATTHFESTYPDVEITGTGMLALLFSTFTNAIMSMRKSYLYALVVITILMILLIGRIRIGLLSMIPNLSPIILTLGIIGWFGIPMNLFVMMVGNVAIGLAVDDTIHFMHNFRRYFERTGDARKAVMETLHTAGRAMLVTSCVLSIGFFIFMFASMRNLLHFGFLTGFTIIMALLADYFIAPALMVVVNRPRPASRPGIEN